MNNFEQIFKITLTLEEKEKLKILNWLYNQGRRLIKVRKKFGENIIELEITQQQLKEFIERI